MKYLIYTTGYNLNSGGITVLHKLAEVLSNINSETYVSCDTTLPNSKAKLISFEESFILALHDDCVVIYPEVIWNNILNAKNVVRWLLYYPVINGFQVNMINPNMYFYIIENTELIQSIQTVQY